MSTRPSRFFPYVMTAYVAILLLSNIVAVKLVPVGPFVWTAGIVIFPISYILGDVITEIYGFRGAKRIIWAGAAANIFMAIVFYVTAALPNLISEADLQYRAVLLTVPRIVVASILGVWCGQFANAYVMSKMKAWTNGRHLWLRTIASTLLGETVDTTIFSFLGFVGVVPFPVILTMIYSAALFKSAYEAAITPITYLVVNWFKRVEGETIDTDLNYRVI